MQRARVLAVAQSPELGGAELALLRLARRLPEHGFDIDVAVPSDGPLAQAARDDGLEVHRLPIGPLEAGGWPGAVSTWPRARGVVRRSAAGLVWLNGAVTQRLAPAISGVPLVPYLHDLPHFRPRPWRYDWFWRRTPVVMCAAGAVADRAAGLGVPRERLRTVYAPVEVVERAPRPGWAADAPVVGYVGRIEHRKGLLDLVRATPAIRPDARIVVVGGGAIGRDDGYEAEVRAEAAGLGARIVFAGPAEDARALMPWFDVLAVPSLEEPFGTAAAESLAAGTPVVATRAGGIQEYLVPGRTGELVPPAEPASLAAAINAVLERPGDMAAACVAAAERFGAARVTADVAAAFGEALDAGT